MQPLPESWTRPHQADQAEGPPTTPFDFIIVGAGAGGAPLAARLVERGFHVLVLEMGPEKPAKGQGAVVENTEVPILHTETTEDPRHTLRYFVKHFDGDASQSQDPKLHKPTQPPQPSESTAGDHVAEDSSESHPADDVGIFYPRAQGVGGCTIHNAMITICGPSEDWDEIAEATGDTSWKGERMRVYFERLENCLYNKPLTWLGRLLSRIGLPTGWENGRHGQGGWLTTSLADLRLIKQEKTFVRLILQSALATLSSGAEQVQDLAHSILRGKPGPALDPNHWETQRKSQAGLSLIPCSIDARGRRSSPREHLAQSKSRFPEQLTIRSNICVTGLQFADGSGAKVGGKPAEKRVVGVKVFPREHAYQADPNWTPSGTDWEQHVQTIYCRKEVILCGGAFNTPQLLLLSGIGPKAQLEALNIPLVSDLPGVGGNLQDRYEVPVVAQLTQHFKSLNGLRLTSQAPDAHDDTELQRWSQLATHPAANANLCSSNGGLLGIFQRSSSESNVPDLFLFSVLGRFPGYSVGYSRPSQLQPGSTQSQTPFAAADQKRYLTWLVLKARTRHNQGTVTLRDTNPFRRPEINFRSFPNATDDSNLAGKDLDLEAILEGVQTIKSMLEVGVKKGTIAQYDLPDLMKFDDDERRWIKHVAWGHHACGTCRIGANNDAKAVLDSRFRVRGVEGVRVVDASIFPRIYGYFIVTNIYMASEKAADVISEDHGAAAGSGEACAPVLPSQQKYEQRRAYPEAFEAREAELVRSRRQMAMPSTKEANASSAGLWLKQLPLDHDSQTTAQADGNAPEEGTADTPEEILPLETLPPDTLGLALSGGGIRSAAFSLGVIQALARGDWLRHVDFLSTVSGGGYTGTFLGRFYDQCTKASGVAGPHTDQEPGSAQERVNSHLADSRSTEISWLRKHANYLSPAGLGEGLFNFATFWRNLASLHVVLGAFFLAAFGISNALGYNLWLANFVSPAKSLVLGLAPLSTLLPTHINPLWITVTELSVWLAVLPLAIAYWLGSQDRHRDFVYSFLIVTLITGISFTLATMQPLGLAVAAAAIGWTIESWWAINRSEGHGNPTSGWRLALGRNHVTTRLAFWVAAVVILLGFAFVDGIGQYLARQLRLNTLSLTGTLTWLGSLLGIVIGTAPVLNWIASFIVSREDSKSGSLLSSIGKIPYLPTLLVLAVGAFLPLVLLSLASHAAYGLGYSYLAGLSATGLALGISVLLGTRESLPFVNRSGPLTIYAARLARVFMGAVNPNRHRHQRGGDVSHVIDGDDVSFEDYAPHRAGGPLHLFNVAINETIDVASRRGIRDRQAENMSVGPAGVNIAMRWHALWSGSGRRPRLRAIDDGTTLHPLQSRANEEVAMEPLSVRNWMAISGAAISPGLGRLTGTATALLFTLVNMRLGYWWDSGLRTQQRARTPMKKSLFETLMKSFFWLFSGQLLLLSELLGRFGGPWRKYWYLSDGGHFENSGVYELLRRRVPFIILCGAGQDRKHEATDIAELSRIARIDFGAEITEVDRAQHSAANDELQTDLQLLDLPPKISKHLGCIADLLGDPDALPKKHATLLKATFDHAQDADAWGGRTVCWILYIKASVTGDEPIDARNYKATHPDFPNETTLDQFFDERQWESYRCLGEHIGGKLFDK